MENLWNFVMKFKNFIFQGWKEWKSPWVLVFTGTFPNGQANAGSWLGTTNVLYYFAQLEQFLLSSFREFIQDSYYLATVARFVHQAFLARNEGIIDELKNVSDAISRSNNSICTEKILFLTDHNVC